MQCQQECCFPQTPAGCCLLCVQVTTLAARLEDLEEHVSDLSTDVRLQACKGLPPLSTAGSHDGSLHNSSGQHCPAILSPRGGDRVLADSTLLVLLSWMTHHLPTMWTFSCTAVAGPAAVRVRSRHASLVGACSGLAPGSATAAPASEESAATAGAPEPSAAVSTPGLESAVDAPKLGALEGMKMWGEGVLVSSRRSSQLSQRKHALGVHTSILCYYAWGASDLLERGCRSLKSKQLYPCRRTSLSRPCSWPQLRPLLLPTHRRLLTGTSSRCWSSEGAKGRLRGGWTPCGSCR